MKKIKLFFLFSILITARINLAQNLYLGGGGAYNPSITQAGFNIKAGLMMVKKLGLVIDYYHYGYGVKGTSEFEPINEFYLNYYLRFDYLQLKKINFYIYAGYLYTKWINEDVNYSGVYQGGAGGIGFEYAFLKSHIFLEGGTNTVWYEPNIMLGIKRNITFKKIFRDGTKKRYDLDFPNNKTP